jgi:hypothetical protein
MVRYASSGLLALATVASGAFSPVGTALSRAQHSLRLSAPSGHQGLRQWRITTAPSMQQRGPLEEGFSELMPMATEEGNVDPELVERVDAEVFELTGVGLDDLLNPSKVVNYERERIILEEQIAESADMDERAELQARLQKVSKQLYSEKRTVFAGWLKAVFVGQALIAMGLGGVAAFDAFPWFTIDLSLRALGFWSFWLFIIPSLRARRPRGWEKVALDIAFLGSPIVTIGAPFLTKDPAAIWGVNLALLAASYAYGYVFGQGETAEPKGRFGAALNALDFGSGQERGVRGAARERMFARQAEEQQGGGEREARKAAETGTATGTGTATATGAGVDTEL